MKKLIYSPLIFYIFIVATISSCKQSKQNDFDFSNIKLPKKITTKKKEIKNNINFENNIPLKDLVPLKDKQEILSKIKFGKKDPFSEGEIQLNNLYRDFKLTGFLNTEINKYVFVSYLDEEGTISEVSIGGINTNLLPDGAKVIKIDPKNMKLIINFENEDFIFEI
mgnify:CR=1 FL=1